LISFIISMVLAPHTVFTSFFFSSEFFFFQHTSVDNFYRRFDTIASKRIAQSSFQFVKLILEFELRGRFSQRDKIRTFMSVSHSAVNVDLMRGKTGSKNNRKMSCFEIIARWFRKVIKSQWQRVFRVYYIVSMIILMHFYNILAISKLFDVPIKFWF